MTHTLRSLLSVTAICLLAGSAHADVLPPDTAACSAKQAGDACTYNGAGYCVNATCSRLDYAGWDRDASASPPTTTYACLKCVPGTAPTDTTTNTATQSATQTSTSPTDTNTATTTVTTTVVSTATKTDDNSSKNDDGWCSVGKKLTAKRVVPWLMAASFSLLFLLGRRRRN